jgi:hypothetical protein
MLQVMSLVLGCHDPAVTVCEATATAGDGLLTAGIFERLADGPVPVFVIGGAIAIVAIISTTISKVTVSRAREQTRREIAAYVAEGTIDADKAVEMLKAGTETA